MFFKSSGLLNPRCGLSLTFAAVFTFASPFASATERWAQDESFRSPVITRSAIADRVTEGPDGKLYLSFFNGGSITGVRGEPQQGAVIRLNADGSYDPSFNIGPKLTSAWGIAFQADGMILVGGLAGPESFQTGPANYRVFRFDHTGRWDPGYQSPVFAGLPRFMTMQPDGNLLVVPSSSDNGNGGIATMARLLAWGELDTSFSEPNLDWGFVFAPPVVAGDGKIYIGGAFDSVDGEFRPSVARLNADGTLDTSYEPSGFTRPSQVRGLAVQQLGANADKLIVAGGPIQVGDSADPQANRPLIRLNLDGTIDSSFNLVTQDEAGMYIRPRMLERLDDDSLVIVGGGVARLTEDGDLFDEGDYIRPYFSTEFFWMEALSDGSVIVPPQSRASINDEPARAVVKISPDGTVDDGFNAPELVGYSYPSRFEVLGDGKILTWGNFDEVNGEERGGLVRLHANGELDEGYFSAGIQAPAYVESADATSDGSVLASVYNPDTFESSIVKLTPNGSEDFSFVVDSAVSADLGSLETRLLSDGKVLVSGSDVQRVLDDTTKLLRLTGMGAIDSAFDTSGLPALGEVYRYGDGSLDSITVGYLDVLGEDDSGRLLARASVGPYEQRAGLIDATLVRINVDGTIDTSFVAPRIPWSTISGFPTIYDAQFSGGVYGQADTTYALSPFEGVKAQPDGKILVYGLFTRIDGQAAAGLARLNSDGSLDTTFTIGSGAEFTLANDRVAQVSDVQVDASGRIWVAGYFSTFDGVSASGIVQLESDGSVVNGFDSGLELIPYVGGSISLRLLDEDTVLVGGSLRRDRSGEFPLPLHRIERLSEGGANWFNDTGFSGPNFYNDTIAGRVTADGDGRLYATFVNGGTLSGADGNPTGAVVRLMADGTVDTSFDIGTFLVSAWAVHPLSDGSVLVGGIASIEDNSTGFTHYRMFKFDESGRPDPGYRSPIFAGIPRFTAMQPDGKLIVVPSGSDEGNGGIRHIARLNHDGSLDHSFHQVWVSSFIFAPPVLDADGKIYIGGVFNSIDGEFRPGVARLNADGSLDRDWIPTGFTQPTQIRGLAIQQNGANAGKLLIAGGALLVESSADPEANRPVVRLNLDGTVDSTFTLVTQADAGLTIRPRLLELRSDDSFMVVGSSVARFLADGALDTGYAQPVFSEEAFWFEMFADGSAIVPPQPGTTLDGSPLTSWVKFDSAGSLDSSFIGPQFETVHFPSRFKVLPSGKLLTWGRFSRVEGVSAPGIVRLNTDGSVDTSFVPADLTAPSYVAFAEVADDGRILVAIMDENGQRTIRRLMPDGAADTSFTIDPGLGDLTGVEVGQLGDGGVHVWASSAQRLLNDDNGIGRLLADGTIDSTFDTDDDFPRLGEVYRNEDGSIRSIVQGNFRQLAIQNDGGIIARSSLGDYPEGAGYVQNTILRLNADGTSDPNFNAPILWWSTFQSFLTLTDATTNGGFPGQVQVNVSSTPFSGAIAQDDGKVLIYGLFTELNGLPRAGLARLNADGSVDESFDVGSGAQFLAAPNRSGAVTGVVPAPGGRFWVTGYFDTFDGLSASGLVLLDDDGDVVDRFSTDLQFRPFVGGINGAETTADESVIVSGSFSANGGAVSAFHRLTAMLGFADGGMPATTWFAGNSELLLEVEVATDRPLTYVWRKDGQVLTGEMGPTLFIGSTLAEDAGNYEVTVDDGQGSVITSSTMLQQIGRPMGGGSLYGIGDLPGGIFLSEVRDATKVDGVIYAVGTSTAKGASTSGDTAILWQSDSGLYALPWSEPASQGQSFVTASAITPDGAFVAARTRVGLGNQRQAVRFNRGDYSQSVLPFPDGFSFYSAATAISDDGAILYGFGYNADFNIRGIRFDAVNQTAEEVPLPAGTYDTMFPGGGRGASSDGLVVVGSVTDNLNSGPDRAFRYEHGVGTVELPLGVGGSWSNALAVSGDGNLTLIAGDSLAAPYGELFFHDSTTGGLTPLGSPNTAWGPSNIMGMTSDATVVVGAFGSPTADSSGSFFRNENGWFRLSAAVHTLGINMEGWEFDNALGISEDGTIVFGQARHHGQEEGFVIEFPAGYLAAFDVTAQPPGDDRIVGTWVLYGENGEEEAIVALEADGTYVHVEVVSEEDFFDGGATGMERGSYTFDTNGSFGVMTRMDTNGDIGLDDLSGRMDLTVVIDGDTLRLDIPGDSGVVLTRLHPSSGTIQGGWSVKYSDGDFSFGAFLPNGHFYWAEDGDPDEFGRAGVEIGTYQWDPETKILTTSVEYDTDGGWGLSSYGSPLTLMVNEAAQTLSITDSEGTDVMNLIARQVIEITQQPMASAVDEGGFLTLSVEASGEGSLQYQWRLNGEAITGRTGFALILTQITQADAGLYDVVITSPEGFRVSAATELVVNPTTTTGRAFTTLSTRAVIAQDRELFLPFRIEGSGDKTLLLRAVGPTLQDFGLSNVMLDPRIRLVDELGYPVAANDDWSSDANAIINANNAVGAFGLRTESKDAALVTMLPPGNYVAIIEGTGPGVVLAELYETELDSPSSRFVYLGVYAPTSPGDGTLTAGFVVPGSETHPLLARAVGPGTELESVIGDPEFRITGSSGAVVTNNDDWRNAAIVMQASAAAGAPALPMDSLDAASRFLAGNGAYTMTVSDEASGSGQVLAEIYEINNRMPSTTPVLLVPPVSRTVMAGFHARFEALAAGEGPLSYQWFKDSTLLDGETGPTLLLPDVSPSDEGQYILQMTNGQGTFAAQSVTLTVVGGTPPMIDDQPVDTTVASGGMATLSVVVSQANGPFTYQWYEGTSGDTSVPIPGGTQPNYETPALSTTTEYWVEVTNSAGRTESDTATVTVQVDSGINANHELFGNGFRPGETVTISTTLNYEGSASSFGWQVHLPAGWSYAGTGGQNVPQVKPSSGQTGLIEWAFLSVEASPVTFNYTLNVPGDAMDPVQISANVLFRDGVNPEQSIAITPSPLVIAPAPPHHSADFNRDFQLDLSELLRVIELYNTRFGTTRTGHYQVQDGSEDGFATNPNLSDSESGNNARFHSADISRDGKLGLSELLRVIELYNFREGTVRTGAYRIQSGSEDGFAPGPEDES